MSDEEYTETTHQSWGNRLCQSLFGVCVGILLFAIAPILLFWNEGRSIERIKVIQEASNAVLPGYITEYSALNDGALVAVSGVLAKPATNLTLKDNAPLPFQISEVLDSHLISLQRQENGPLLYLHRDVSYFEWKEDVETTTKKTAGGGETTTKNYSYSKTWTSTHYDSNNFKNSQYHQNMKPQYEDASFTTHDKVILMQFDENTDMWLSPSLVNELIDRTWGGTDIGLALNWRPSTSEINPAGPPEIGDNKFTWKAVGPTVVSALAMQYSGGSLGTWISSQGRDFTYINVGTLTTFGMIKAAEKENAMTTWIIRAVGLIVWWISFSMIAKPLSVVADVATIPCLGFEPGTLVEYLTGCVAFLTSSICSLITISLAWLFYRPLYAVILIIFAVGITIFARQQVAKNKKKEPQYSFAPIELTNRDIKPIN
uniref:Uncharacterized protein n=1 Tax=Corethron hystrix TaxID=216773 RepID=A0A7S1BGP9_9STRA|mmetsp:Transcript_27109/g.62322  ORF Transcript_27109/g.62322 Transcript_27109/m.62322 type:complete len:429 (+) Transcript_27109:121-1407(+)